MTSTQSISAHTAIRKNINFNSSTNFPQFIPQGCHNLLSECQTPRFANKPYNLLAEPQDDLMHKSTQVYQPKSSYRGLTSHAGFPAGLFFFLGGGGDSPPPLKKSVTPPKIVTAFIFIHPEPPTPRLLPPPKSFNSPPKGEILQETLPW